MIDFEKTIEINGKRYELDEAYEDSGISYHEVTPIEYQSGHVYWEPVNDALVLCGNCRGDVFKVSSCNRNYESWAYCSCGNKFLLHTG